MNKRRVCKSAVAALALVGLAACVETAGFGAPPAVRNDLARAEADDANAQYRLGIRYTNDQGVEQDYAAATRWFVKAASLGHADASYMAGINLYTGRGAGVDFPRALAMFRDAARKGHMQARYQLGDAYANGRGAPKNLAWAARWYEQAARQGHAAAMMAFGVMRASGLGVAKDALDAWVWLELAARRAEPQAAQVLDRVAKGLAATQLADGRRRADGWKPESIALPADTATLRFVQHALNQIGLAAGPEDGVAGPQTRRAVLAYQAGKGLAVTGDVSDRLTEALVAQTASATE